MSSASSLALVPGEALSVPWSEAELNGSEPFLWVPSLSLSTELSVNAPCCSRYALVDFGLAQGTPDTQIELLKVVKLNSHQERPPGPPAERVAQSAVATPGPALQHPLVPAARRSLPVAQAKRSKVLLRLPLSVKNHTVPCEWINSQMGLQKLTLTKAINR